MKSQVRAYRSAFTLVELLVVMVIIAVVSTLAIMGVNTAWIFVLHNEQYHENANLSVGMEKFRTQFDLFPPDGSGGSETVQRFATAAFPDRRGGSPPPNINPGTAVVFWLSGIHKDVYDPFKHIEAGEDPTQRYRFYEFKPDRLVQGLYFPPRSEPANGDHPYVYFHFPTYDRAAYRHVSDAPPFRPYRMSGAGGGRGPGTDQRASFANPESFQMIGPGLDKRLGTGGTLLSETIVAGAPAGTYISEADEDNVVNFDARKVGDIK